MADILYKLDQIIRQLWLIIDLSNRHIAPEPILEQAISLTVGGSHTTILNYKKQLIRFGYIRQIPFTKNYEILNVVKKTPETKKLDEYEKKEEEKK